MGRPKAARPATGCSETSETSVRRQRERALVAERPHCAGLVLIPLCYCSISFMYRLTYSSHHCFPALPSTPLPLLSSHPSFSSFLFTSVPTSSSAPCVFAVRLANDSVLWMVVLPILVITTPSFLHPASVEFLATPRHQTLCSTVL